MVLTVKDIEKIYKMIDTRISKIEITREDFSKLKEIVEELAEAQKRSEERFSRLEAAIEELVQAQKRSEERIGRLEAVVEELAQAQKRTEERVGRLEAVVEELAQAQKRTEERIEELAQIQIKTEKQVTKLSREMKNLAIQVGRLSETVGFSIEDVARVMLPSYLQRHYGIEIQELERKFIEITDVKEPIEINLYGEGMKDNKKIIIIGESKSRIYERDVKDFIRRFELIKNEFKEEICKVMFGFYIHPSASKAAEVTNTILVASYQK